MAWLLRASENLGSIRLVNAVVLVAGDFRALLCSGRAPRLGGRHIGQEKITVPHLSDARGGTASAPVNPSDGGGYVSYHNCPGLRTSTALA